MSFFNIIQVHILINLVDKAELDVGVVTLVGCFEYVLTEVIGSSKIVTQDEGMATLITLMHALPNWVHICQICMKHIVYMEMRRRRPNV